MPAKAVAARVVVRATFLGPFSVQIGRGDHFVDVQIPLRRARKLLAFLLATPRRQFGRQRIFEALWIEAGDERPEANFHPTLTALRRALSASSPAGEGTFMVSRGDHLRLDPEVDWHTDVIALESALAAGRSHLEAGDRKPAVEVWESCWRRFGGEYLAGWNDPWIEEPRGYWRRKRHDLLRGLAELYFEAGRYQDSVDARRSVLSDEPLSEPDHKALLSALAALGRRDLVRAQYERMARLLLEELGVEPLPETAAAYRQLMNLRPGPRSEG